MKSLFTKDTYVITAACGSISFMVYLLHLQSYDFSLRALGYFLIIWAITCLFSLLLWKKAIVKHFFRINLSIRWLVFATCLACGFLSIPSQIPTLLALLPIHKMQVDIHQQDPSELIVLEGFNNGIIYTSLDDLSHEGEWQREGNRLTARDKDASLSWSGRTGESTYLIFQPSSKTRTIELFWDGSREVIYTSGQETEPIIIYHTFDLPWATKATIILTFGLAYSSLFFALIILFASIHTSPNENPNPKRLDWLKLAIPPVFVWLIYLLTFFPALMTLDSFYSWDQLFTHVYQDLHPVSYTLYLWLLSRVWFSPAAVNLFQIICLSLVVASALGFMMRHGLPGWVAWSISFIYALFPINGLLINSIWKDIPYSIALLWLFIISMRIVMHDGVWLKKKVHVFLLGALCAIAGLMRHNGLVVSISLLFLLYILYPAYRKAILWSLLVFLTIWGMVKGPIYRLLNVKTYAISSDQVLIYHIGAHINAATPLRPDEVSFLDAIQTYPDWWQYNTCSINNILANGQFDAEYYGENRWRGWQLFFSLLKRDPWVNINHVYQSSAYLVKLEKSGCSPKVAFLRGGESGYMWISPDNSLHENTQLPFLVPPLYELYTWISDIGFLTMPAFYLYLSIALILSFVMRMADLRWLVLLAVPVVQSVVMYAANVSNEFRFQYGIVLISILCLALLFWNPDNSSA